MTGKNLIGYNLFSRKEPFIGEWFHVIEYDEENSGKEYKVGILNNNLNVDKYIRLSQDFVDCCDIEIPNKMSVKRLIGILSSYDQDAKVSIRLSCTDYGSCELKIGDDVIMGEDF